MSKWKIAGINFDHLHMGDNLRMAFEHADVEIVGICDEQPERMKQACADFAIPADRVFSDYRECLEKTQPDIVLLCPATAEHGEWTEKVAPFGVHIIMEKPFAATLAEADRMQRAMEGTGKLLAINWPLAWYPTASHGAAAHLRRRDRRGNRSPLLRRQPRAAVAPRRQSGAHRRRRRARKAHELVLQKGGGRWLSAGLSRVRHHIGYLVHGRPGTD